MGECNKEKTKATKQEIVSRIVSGVLATTTMILVLIFVNSFAKLMYDRMFLVAMILSCSLTIIASVVSAIFVRSIWSKIFQIILCLVWCAAFIYLLDTIGIISQMQ